MSEFRIERVKNPIESVVISNESESVYVSFSGTPIQFSTGPGAPKGIANLATYITATYGEHNITFPVRIPALRALSEGLIALADQIEEAE